MKRRGVKGEFWRRRHIAAGEVDFIPADLNEHVIAWLGERHRRLLEPTPEEIRQRRERVRIGRLIRRRGGEGHRPPKAIETLDGSRWWHDAKDAGFHLRRKATSIREAIRKGSPCGRGGVRLRYSEHATREAWEAARRQEAA